MADDRVVAARFGVERAVAAEVLLDCQAFGWVTWSEFAGTGGWSLTEAGRAENERQLAAELAGLAELGGRAELGGLADLEEPAGEEESADIAGAEVVREAYGVFLSLNERLQRACTDWQIRPTAEDSLAFNDHSDPAWDGKVIDELTALGKALEAVSERLTSVLDRFQGYDTRFSAALGRVIAGDSSWVDRTGADSCHTVWFELHEDLIATLGLARGAELSVEN
ncbi:transcriptional regulator [Kribbella qitaiheensis]|uniref:transcriptional regulator n=1 Tax=Kribbella qitaiheensis TaxID=1544730 RepID=UPI00360D086E